MPEPRYKVVNGEYIELTQSELDEMAARAEAADLDMNMVRADRNAKLGAADWTQLGDAALGDHTATEWATYRQALRDLPSVYGRVSEVVWPETPPEEAARLVAEAEAEAARVAAL